MSEEFTVESARGLNPSAIGLPEDQLRIMRKRKLALEELKKLYEQMEQASEAIVEKLEKFAYCNLDVLTDDEKQVLHKRFNWFACYKRHVILQEECLHIAREVYVSRDAYGGWGEE